MRDGERAGLEAAQHLGLATGPLPAARPELRGPPHRYPCFARPDGKNFVDFDEDLQLERVGLGVADAGSVAAAGGEVGTGEGSGVALDLLADIGKNTVDFSDNFDGTLSEPLVLPSALPNIVTGMRIAAGLAVIGTIVGEFVADFCDRARQRDIQLVYASEALVYHSQRLDACGFVRQHLRYGREGKDYFWIQDLGRPFPRMIMHPYRADLNGQDLSGFTDPRGVAIFVEFADLGE